MRTNAVGMRARLARLEKLSGKGRCPFCRLERRHKWADSAKPPAGPEGSSLTVTAHCELCGAPWRCDLSDYPEELRGVARLYYASELEDLYTDPRAWAAQRWMGYWEEARRQNRMGPREPQGLSVPARSPLRHKDYRRRLGQLERARALAKDPDVKRYLGLLVQILALILPRLRRLERRYGENPFPELESRVAAIVGPDLSLMSPKERMAYTREALERPLRRGGAWLLCAEMERVVLGGVSAYTARKIADCERRAQERSAEAEALLVIGRERLRALEGQGDRAGHRLGDPAAPQIPAAATPPAPADPQSQSVIDYGTVAYSQSLSQPRNPAAPPRAAETAAVRAASYPQPPSPRERWTPQGFHKLSKPFTGPRSRGRR